MADPVTVVSSLSQFKEIVNSDKYSVFDFWATWCGPCRAISPVFSKLAKEHHESGVGFYKVDIDEVPDVAEEVGIQSMPTFIVFKDGNKVETVKGAYPDKVTDLITRAVKDDFKPQSV